MEQIKEPDLEGVGGGFANVSDPIYKLEKREKEILKKMGFNVKDTNSGNSRVYYSNGCTIEPHVLSWMCQTINTCDKNKK